jgi:heme oxygenase
MFLEDIKARTSESHIKLEKSALLSLFSTQQIDLHSYRLILALFYGYFHPLEQKLDAVAGIRLYLTDYETRRKSSLLLSDIQALREQSVADVALPLCPDLPPVTDEAQAFGCLYVMEGSTLGGKFIARQLHNQLGLTPSSGAAFFNGYGEETGLRWKTFQQALRTFSERSGQQEAIIQSANQTFLKLDGWMNTNQSNHALLLQPV